MKEQLNAFAVYHSTCFRRTGQVSNLLKLATSNKNNENNNNNNNKKIIIIIIQIMQIGGVFWRISADFGVFQSLGVFRSF